MVNSLLSSPGGVLLLSLQLVFDLRKRTRVGLGPLLAAKQPEMMQRPLQTPRVLVQRGGFLQINDLSGYLLTFVDIQGDRLVDPARAIYWYQTILPGLY